MEQALRIKLRKLFYSSTLLMILISVGFNFHSCNPKDPTPVLYTSSQVEHQKELLKVEIKNHYFQQEQKLLDSITNKHLKDIEVLNREKAMLQATSSKLNKELKELRKKFNDSNSLEDCIILSNAQQEQLTKYEDIITNLEQEAQHWCEAYETSELKLLKARDFLIVKDTTIQRLSDNLIKLQIENASLIKQKESLQEEINKQKRRTKNTGLITGALGFLAGIFIN